MSMSEHMYYLCFCAWRFRYLIVVPTLLFPLFGGVLGTMGEKKYTGHTSMLVQETAKLNPFLEDLAVSSMLKNRMAALETLLHSRYILGKVAIEQGLIEEEHSAWELERAVGKLSSNLSVSMVGKDLIRIQYTDTNPTIIKDTLESVSRHFVEQLLAPERSSISDSSVFLKEHIEKRRLDLDKAEQALADYKNTHAHLLPELHVSNVSRLNSLRKDLAEKQAELAGVNHALGGIDQQLMGTNPIVGKIEEKLIELNSELTALRARYTDKHSRVIALNRQIKRLEEERGSVLVASSKITNKDKLWDIVASQISGSEAEAKPLLLSQLENMQVARGKSDALSAEVKVLSDMIDELESQVSSFGKNEHELIRLQRDLEVKKELYADLLKRFELAQVTGSLSKFEESKRIKVIDLPYNPSTPNNLPAVLFVIAGIFGGLAFGSGLAIILGMTDTRLRTRQQIESHTGMPVLGRFSRLEIPVN